MTKTHHGIGLMSGTSLDGLDIAYCSFEQKQGKWSYQILHTTCINFPDGLIQKLKIAPSLSSEKLIALDIEFGLWLGGQVKDFITSHNISPQYIASHGYTVFHQPEHGFTHQIGSGEEIYAACNVAVINNFRQLDVSLGGQGAPLVPIGDELLFGEYDACINLGGIANISYDMNGTRIAFDNCPANMVLNYLAEKEGKSYDHDGNMARSGKLLLPLFEKLNKLSYYNKSFPKSLGFEWVRDCIFSLEEFNNENTADLAHTFTHHIAHIIKADISKIHKTKGKLNVLITGGGSHNSYLIETIKNALGNNAQTDKASDELIDYKEALIFAFLGLLRIKHIPNCLKSVTGAKRDNCGGSVIGSLKF